MQKIAETHCILWYDHVIWARMRIIEDTEGRLVIRSRPWVAWIAAWPSIVLGAFFFFFPSLDDAGRGAPIVTLFGIACLVGTDFSLLVVADKITRRVRVQKRWLWKRTVEEANFKDVISVVHVVDATSFDWPVAHRIVIHLSGKRTIKLRNAALFVRENVITRGLGDAISRRVKVETEHVPLG